MGISEDMTSRVFDKFFRVPAGNVHSVKGFGLGLSFVKSIIEKHHGHIRLLSTLGQGTHMKILLPKL